MLKKALIGSGLLLVAFVVYWIFFYKPKHPEATNYTSPNTASAASSTMKPAVGTATPPAQEVMEEVLTICDFSQTILNVNADSGRNSIIGVTFVEAIDSTGEKFTLLFPNPIMFSRGDEYTVTYHALSETPKIEDLHRNDNFGSHPVLPNKIEARGVIVSAVLVKK